MARDKEEFSFDDFHLDDDYSSDLFNSEEYLSLPDEDPEDDGEPLEDMPHNRLIGSQETDTRPEAPEGNHTPRMDSQWLQEAEEALLGTPKDAKKDNSSTPAEQEDASDHADRQYIDGLIAVAEGVGDDELSDAQEAMESQRIINAQLEASGDAPDGIALIDDPIDEHNKPLPVGKSGDEKTLTFMQGIGIACATAVVMFIGFSAAMIFKPAPEPVALPPETTQPSGSIIDQAIAGRQQDDNQGDDGDDDRQDDEDSSADDGDSQEIRYELVSEGGIKTASVSYINGAGSKESETGVELPWSKTIGGGESITPHFAANPGERGTLTCKVYRGDEKIAEDTASGEKASVECRAED